MTTLKATDVRKGITALWETLQCPICLDLMTTPLSTKCDHHFCKFCITKLLDNSKQNRANCPVCKSKVTKRSLQESPRFQNLVAGLQDIIQAYEQDTSTNYFTGLPQQRRNTHVTNTETTKNVCNLSSGDRGDSQQSCSSTVAAQIGFAEVMGFKNSASVTTENEGLDSSMGDPPTSDKKTSSSTDNLEPETVHLGKKATLTHAAKNKRSTVKPEKSEPNQEEPGQQHVRKSSRNKEKKDLESDEIFEQKKRESLEKVAEWLLKVPVEEELEQEKSLHNRDESESCSSTPMVDVDPQDVELNLKREDCAKALEEQVFGAVYKRRGSKVIELPMAKKNIGICEERQAVEKDPSSDFLRELMEMEVEEKPDEEQVFGAVYKRRRSKVIEPPTTKEIQNCNNLSKLRKKKNIGLCEERQTVDTMSDFLIEVKEKLDKNVEGLNQKHQGEHEIPVAEITQQETTPLPGRACKSLQELDTDLQEQTHLNLKGGEEKNDRRKRTNTKSSTKKQAKVAKPLVLVPVQNRETSLKPNKRDKEVEVQIETYPSSEDPTTPVIKRARRSRRLQLFVEEIQGSRKKTNSESMATKKQTENNNDKTMAAAGPKTGNPSKKAKRNGCVYEEDIGGIESAENSGRTSLRQAEAEVPEVQTLATAAADCGASVVPNSTSPIDPSMVGPTLVSEKQGSNCSPDPQQETRVNEADCAIEEHEYGKNDSELDTEQLLRSFKAAKRKSFHLGQPNMKRSRRLDENSAEESHPVCSSPELSESIIQVSKGSEKSLCSNVISPSNSPICIGKLDQAVLEASNPETNCSEQGGDAENCPSRSSFSSGLSPNKVSKRDRESPLFVVPQVVDSGLRFTADDHEASKCSQVTEGQSDNLKEITDGIPKDPSVHKPESSFVGESSLTPDGLETPAGQGILEAKGSCSLEVSNQSSIKISARKKRRTQRLESSSESVSSGSKEELPTLAQIFGMTDPPQAELKDQEEISGARIVHGVDGSADTVEPPGRPPACPSPDRLDSSQGSVDLFGTPDELNPPERQQLDYLPSVCDAPENDIGDIESSQFSSEVLVTQQKIEMQKELVRLEKLMALVSEVLQEKEGSPAREGPSETHHGCKNIGPDVHRPLLKDQDPVQGSDRKDDLDGKTRPSDDKVVTETGVAKRSGISETAVHRSTHAGSTGKDTETINSTSSTKTTKNCNSPPDGQEDKENNSPPTERSKPKLVLVSSGLGPQEQIMVKRFAKRVGGHVVSQVTPEVTHVIMRTDDQLVCERTLKYFLGIAGRKWVVSFNWISESFKEKKLLEESSFEVRGDVVNGPTHQGPLRARTTADSNLLLKGYKICCKGPFTDMSTDDLAGMVELCGATVVKDPLLLDGKQRSHQIIIVQPRSDLSSSPYTSLSRKATVVTRGWLLDTVATYTLQNYSSYTV